MTKKIPKKIEEPIKLFPVYSPPLVYGSYFIWIIFVLITYFKNFPLTFAATGLLFDFEISLSLSKLFSHIYAILCAVLIFIAGFGVGKLFLDRFFLSEDLDKKEKIFFYIIFGCGTIALFTLIVGILGFLYKGLFWLVVATAAFNGVVGLAYIFKPSRQSKKSHLGSAEIFALFVFLCIAFVNLFGALTPETFYDSQFYQIGLPTKWILEKKISSDNFVSPSFFPFNVNMLYLVVMLLNNEISAKLVHYFCGILITFGIYIFCKKYFSETIGIFAALIFYSVPLVMMVSWKTAIELGIGIFEFAVLFSLLNYFTTNKKIWIILSGVFCGFSLGSKYTGIAFCYFPWLVTLIFINVVRKEKFPSAIKDVLLFSAVSFLAAMPWYAKNLILSGNPVFPFFWSKIGFLEIRSTGSLFADPPYPKFNFVNYFLFLWPMTFGKLQQESVPGVMFLTFIPLIFLFRKIDPKIKYMLFYSVIAIICWAVFGRFYLRYFIPVLSVVSIIISYYVFESSRTVKTLKIFYSLLIIFIAFNNLNFCSYVLKTTQDPMPYIFDSITKKEYLSTQRPSYPAPYYQTLSWANENLPKESKILFLGEARGAYCERIFYAYGVSDFSHLIEWCKKVESGDGLYEVLKKEGITHILFNVPEGKRIAGYDIFYFEPRELKIFDEFWRKYVREIYKDIADIYLPQHGIKSMKKEQPHWWAQYSADPKNYVYLYKIYSHLEAKLKPVPYNFLLLKEFYTSERWDRIKPIVENLKEV